MNVHVFNTTPSLVTFVIPSLGRESLAMSINSLRMQNDPYWKCIIGYDGKPEMINYVDDPRISYLEFTKIGSAGLVRNKIIEHVDTPWIAFLDDDDFIYPTYITKLRQYSLESPQPDVIHFSMLYPKTKRVLPDPLLNDVLCGEFGISFAVRTSLIKEHNILFREGIEEDYYFLKECQQHGIIIVTHDVQYIVPKSGAITVCVL